MSDILDKILKYKRKEVESSKNEKPLGNLETEAAAAEPVRPFKGALEAKIANGQFALIAEIKKASPSKGVIREDFDPPSHARAYEEGGAACLSVLTDGPSFQGRLDFLSDARAACSLPVLRKDFMVDPYQVAEARAYGADCILLILSAIDDELARELAGEAGRYGMNVLTEVHTQDELKRAIQLESEIIGINNRNLKTFDTDLNVSIELSRDIENALVVSESGVYTHDDLVRLGDADIRTVLVGESLMRQSDITAATKSLLFG